MFVRFEYLFTLCTILITSFSPLLKFRDNLKKYTNVKRTWLSEHQIVLSEDIIEHHRDVQDILEIVSELGGLLKFVLTAVVFIGERFSMSKYYSELIERLYLSKSRGSLVFSKKDALFGKNETFKKGKKLVQDQLEVSNILIQFAKIKSILSVLVSSDKRLIYRARKRYL